MASRGRQCSYCRNAWRALRIPRLSEKRTSRCSRPRKRYGAGRRRSGSGSNRRHNESPNSRHENPSRNHQAGESTQSGRSANAQGKRGDWRYRYLSPGGAAIQRETSRAVEELRSASRHRHRERAAAQRIAGAHRRPHRSARAADCHVGGAARYLKLSR
jgi:hypothetical protein